MPSRQFTITTEKFLAYLAQLPSEGFTVTPTGPLGDGASTGKVKGKGYIMSYSFDGETLTIRGVDKKFFSLPWETVLDIVQEHLT